MWRRPVRRVHGVDRRLADALLHYAGGQDRAKKNHDHRRAGAGRAAASVAAGISRCRRDAMRLLHLGHDHGRGRAAEAETEPVSVRNRSLDGREYLSLRHLSSHHRSHQTSCEYEGRREPMKQKHPTSFVPANPPLTPPGRGTDTRLAPDSSPPLEEAGVGSATEFVDAAGRELPIEPERYELHTAPLHHFDLARRDFFKVLGGGVVVLFLVEEALAQESGGGRRRGGFGQRRPQELGTWLHIGEDGVVTVFTGKAEVGQNIRTSLTQVVAEELRIPVRSIRLTMADTELTPYDAGTFGSRTTPDMAVQLRKVSATAREVLIELATDLWKADRKSLVSADGEIVHSDTKQSVSFGELTKGQKLLKSVADNPPTTPAAQWKVAGTPVAKVDGRDFVTGKHQYTTDIRLPGMLHGKVLRPAAFGATLASLEAKEAEARPGVRLVRDGDFVGVTAPTEHQAAQAVAAIRAEWKTTPQTSDGELFEHLKGKSSDSPDRGDSSAPSANSSADKPAASDHKLQATYTVAYIAHA